MLLQNSFQVHLGFVKSICNANINSSTEVTKHDHIITTSYSNQLFMFSMITRNAKMMNSYPRDDPATSKT